MRFIDKSMGVAKSIKFELSKDLVVIQRSMYTCLDLLSEIGGFQVALVTLVSLMLKLLDRNSLEEHLIRKLFEKSISEDGSYIRQA